jgi:hypothetical protein
MKMSAIKDKLAELEDAYSFLRDPAIGMAIEEIKVLRSRIEDLESELQYLNDLIFPKINPFDYQLGLTLQESALLYVMYRMEKVSQWHLDEVTSSIDTKRSSNEDAVDLRTKVTICNMRKKLKSIGCEILNYRGFGYGLTPESKVILQEYIKK